MSPEAARPAAVPMAKMAGGAALAIVVASQLLVGTFGGAESRWRADRPFEQDHWYYAGLGRAVVSRFPPVNPAFSGAPLTQPAFHLAPLGALMALRVDACLAMRLLNVAWAVLFMLTLRRYFPGQYGLMALGALAAAPPANALLGPLAPAGEINPLSVDLATRGFHHLPFFIALLAAVFERRRPALGAAAAFALPWLHALMAAACLPAVVFALWRERRGRRLAALGAGCAALAAFVFWATRGQGGGPLLDSLGFYPAEPLRRLVPLGAAFWLARAPFTRALALSAFALSCVVGWNRFYFLFPLDFALALAAGEAWASPWPRARQLTAAVLIAAVGLHGVWLWQRFSGAAPYSRAPVAGAIAWIRRETPPRALFMQAPTPTQALSDEGPYRRLGFGYWLLEARNLFVGYYGWAQDAGLPGDARSLGVDRVFKGLDPPPIEVDYIFYGPMERAMYDAPRPSLGRVVYRDDAVTILDCARPPR